VATRSSSKKKAPPKVRARSRGQTSDLMTGIENKVKENHPDIELRWVFSPEHDDKYSQIWKRQVAGYSIVDPEEEGLEMPHGKVGGRIQVGDLVLMSVPKDVRAEKDAELAERAKSEASRSREAYYESMQGLAAGRHRGRPTGDIKGREEEVSLTMPEKE